MPAVDRFAVPQEPGTSGPPLVEQRDVLLYRSRDFPCFEVSSATRTSAAVTLPRLTHRATGSTLSAEFQIGSSRFAKHSLTGTPTKLTRDDFRPF